MANRTDPLAATAHGTNPQFLVEKIIRNRIYECAYWKDACFGLTAATVIDRAIALDHVGGSYSANIKPTPFICLVLKLLQISPEPEIVQAYLNAKQHKYLRLLGAFYMRLIGRPAAVYEALEPLLEDYRKVARRSVTGWTLLHVDEFVDELLTQEMCCDIALPHLPKREALEAAGYLLPRKSVLDDDIDAAMHASEASAAPLPPAPPLPTAASALIEAAMSASAASDAVAVAAAPREADRSAVSRRNAEYSDSARAPSQRDDRPQHRHDDDSFRRRQRPRSPEYHRRRDDDDYHRSRYRDDDDRHGSRHRDEDEWRDRRHDRYDDDAPRSRRDDDSRRRGGADYDNDPRRPAERDEASAAKSTPAEGTTEYWNAQRAALGLKPLK